MELNEATISTKTVKVVGIVTSCVTFKPFGIRTYGKGFKRMKTFNFNPCISHTYDARACNPCISNTYEKEGGGGPDCCKVVQFGFISGGKKEVAHG
jgi:hypothetical protein